MIPQRSPSPLSLVRQPLPPGHFLSLPPSYHDQSTPSFPSGSPTTSSHLSQGQAPNVASVASADFGVDVRTGFLPATTNVDRLTETWELWEIALDAAMGDNGPGSGLQLGGRREKDKLWRRGIESMPILSTDGLKVSLPLLRRAHVVLTFLLHFYVHTSPSSSTLTAPLLLPPSIAQPVVAISPLLGLPPIVTYADTVLYNFHPLKSSTSPSLPLNPPSTALVTFTRTRSEEQFYIISALCEIAGAEALKLMRQSLDELFLADEVALRRLTVYLRRLASQIDKIGDITLQIMKEVDPEEFYHLIRPWFRGGDAEGPMSLGWDFGEEVEAEWAAENQLARSISSGLKEAGQSVEDKGEKKQKKGRLFSGPSAGQSSLIHAIDIFLTVDHSEDDEEKKSKIAEAGPQTTNRTTTSAPSTPPSTPEPHVPSIRTDSTPTTATTSSHPTEATFLQRMLQYMPGPHRTFLLHLSTHPTPLRTLVLSSAQTHPKLAEAYDNALEALKQFREKHMRVVSVFIVQQARRKASLRIRKLMGEVEEGEMEEDEEEEEEKMEVGELRGTGGTPLFKFLKRCRDNTTKAMVGKRAGAGFDLQ